MSDIYSVKYTAIITGTATYAIPEGEKISHFVDGDAASVQWDLSTIRDVEIHDSEYLHSEEDEDEGVEVPPTAINDDIPF